MSIMSHNAVPYGIIPTKQVVGDTVLQPTITHNYTPTVEQNRSGKFESAEEEAILRVIAPSLFWSGLQLVAASVLLNQLVEWGKAQFINPKPVLVVAQPVHYQQRAGADYSDYAKMALEQMLKVLPASNSLPSEVMKALGEGLSNIEMGEYHRNTGNLIEARKQWETGLQKVKSLSAGIPSYIDAMAQLGVLKAMKGLAETEVVEQHPSWFGRLLQRSVTTAVTPKAISESENKALHAQGMKVLNLVNNSMETVITTDFGAGAIDRTLNTIHLTNGISVTLDNNQLLTITHPSVTNLIPPEYVKTRSSEHKRLAKYPIGVTDINSGSNFINMIVMGSTPANDQWVFLNNHFPAYKIAKLSNYYIENPFLSVAVTPASFLGGLIDNITGAERHLLERTYIHFEPNPNSIESQVLQLLNVPAPRNESFQTYMSFRPLTHHGTAQTTSLLAKKLGVPHEQYPEP